MMQKIVVKVQMHSDKCRTKALMIAAAAQGVSKVSIEGEDRDHVEVIGDGVDSVSLTMSLRKKLGFADIIKVEDVSVTGEENNVDDPLPSPVSTDTNANFIHCPPQFQYPMHYQVVVHDPYPEPSLSNCSVM